MTHRMRMAMCVLPFVVVLRMQSTWKRASYLLCRAKDVWGQAQERFNTFLQAEVADKVLQHFNGQEKVQLACVCRVWRMWVSSSSSTVHLSGPDVQGQLTWLVQRIPARMLKVTSQERH